MKMAHYKEVQSKVNKSIAKYVNLYQTSLVIQISTFYFNPAVPCCTLMKFIKFIYVTFHSIH